MSQYQRKTKLVDAFQWTRDSDPKTWPEWARLYRAQDGMGSHSGLATSGVGTLLIPALPSSKHVEPGQWLVFDGEIAEDAVGAKTARGVITVLTTEQFEADYEPFGRTTAAELLDPTKPDPDAPQAPAADAVVAETPAAETTVTETPAPASPVETPAEEGAKPKPAKTK